MLMPKFVHYLGKMSKHRKMSQIDHEETNLESKDGGRWDESWAERLQNCRRKGEIFQTLQAETESLEGISAWKWQGNSNPSLSITS